MVISEIRGNTPTKGTGFEMIRIWIADDQTLLREGLQTLLNLEPDMEVIGVSDNGQDAWEAVKIHRPDLVLMDIKMPVLDGIEAMRRIKKDAPSTLVLMLTTFAEEKLIVSAIASGADGFLLKDMPGDRLAMTVRDAVEGHIMLPASVAAKLAVSLTKMNHFLPDIFDERRLNELGLTFTERERKIILRLIEGYSNKQIAGSMFMSEGTVRNYISVIYDKIGTNDRQEAIMRLKELLLQDAP